VLRPGKAGAFFCLNCRLPRQRRFKWGGGEDRELGAGAGEEWSGVQTVGDGGRCGEIGRERVCTGVGEAAGVGVGGN
jgi:hypothetical protein